MFAVQTCALLGTPRDAIGTSLLHYCGLCFCELQSTRTLNIVPLKCNTSLSRQAREANGSTRARVIVHIWRTGIGRGCRKVDNTITGPGRMRSWVGPGKGDGLWGTGVQKTGNMMGEHNVENGDSIEYLSSRRSSTWKRYDLREDKEQALEAKASVHGYGLVLVRQTCDPAGSMEAASMKRDEVAEGNFVARHTFSGRRGWTVGCTGARRSIEGRRETQDDNGWPPSSPPTPREAIVGRVGDGPSGRASWRRIRLANRQLVEVKYTYVVSLLQGQPTGNRAFQRCAMPWTGYSGDRGQKGTDDVDVDRCLLYLPSTRIDKAMNDWSPGSRKEEQAALNHGDSYGDMVRRLDGPMTAIPREVDGWKNRDSRGLSRIGEIVADIRKPVLHGHRLSEGEEGTVRMNLSEPLFAVQQSYPGPDSLRPLPSIHTWFTDELDRASPVKTNTAMSAELQVSADGKAYQSSEPQQRNGFLPKLQTVVGLPHVGGIPVCPPFPRMSETGAVSEPLKSGSVGTGLNALPPGTCKCCNGIGGVSAICASCSECRHYGPTISRSPFGESHGTVDCAIKPRRPYPNAYQLPVVFSSETRERMTVRWTTTSIRGVETEVYQDDVAPRLPLIKGETVRRIRNAVVYGPVNHHGHVMPCGDIWVKASRPSVVSISLGNGNWIEWRGNERAEDVSHPLLPSRRLWFDFEDEFLWIKVGGIHARRTAWSANLRRSSESMLARGLLIEDGRPCPENVDAIVTIMDIPKPERTRMRNDVVACTFCYRAKAKCLSINDKVGCYRCRDLGLLCSRSGVSKHQKKRVTPAGDREKRIKKARV
ncbi:hypothetical protein BV25DRAFT_1835438 [Artomyces pyxidatus]|uniref:Uncharacterized protein n=1 Tax=Artomyces pyxidatus TaxID=48021 RepID=A0ACB8TFD4_9AGAM|nr:hypothetical protein BV25DRAFT_1835438 [Artomyces pyxidatus]